MPPLMALKLLLRMAVTVVFPWKQPLSVRKDTYVIQFIDVKKAHFWAKAERVLYIELPWEYKQAHNIVGNSVGLLKRSMYGMRDAAALWESLVAAIMNKLGFQQGKSTPCVFWHPSRDIRTTVHGDNFASLGTRLDVDWFESVLKKEFMIKVEGIFGPPGTPDCVYCVRTLNRLLTWTSEGIEWESERPWNKRQKQET